MSERFRQKRGPERQSAQTIDAGRQNTSAAVMQQRHEAHDSLDHFPTPPWATRALCEYLARTEPLHLLSAWEPACAEGHMARPLGEYFDKVWATDVQDYGYPGMAQTYDFLLPPSDHWAVDWIITNPPFKLGAEFILQALDIAREGVAMFVRTSFMEGQGRYEQLFEPFPETDVLPFVERVVLWKGCLLDPDVPVTRWNDKRGEYVSEKPTSATSYAWLVWNKNAVTSGKLHRIAPCRKALTRPGDYPPLPEELRGPPDFGDAVRRYGEALRGYCDLFGEAG